MMCLNRKDFVPNFITMAEANLIFRAGKNLNFLVDVCKSSDVFSDKARLFQLYKNIDSTFFFLFLYE